MELVDVVRYFGALFLVLALVGAAGLAVRYFGLAGLAGLVGGKGGRLGVLETMTLGPRHRLYLIRCDESEHVIVVGPQGATLIDQLRGASHSGPVPAGSVSGKGT